MEHKVRSGCVRFRYVGPLEVAGSHDFFIVQGVEYIKLEFSIASLKLLKKDTSTKQEEQFMQKNASTFNSISQRASALYFKR